MKKGNLRISFLAVVCGVILSACSKGGGNTSTQGADTTALVSTEAPATTTETTKEESSLAAETTAAETEKTGESGTKLRIGQVEGAAHGDKCFTVATAVIDGNDRIVAAYIDEFQFLDDRQIGVPNSDAFIADGSVAEGKVLASKRVNNAYYSENMKKAGSTVDIAVNFDEIQKFAAGKTIEELEEVAALPAGEAVDAVSGATLEDTAGYLAVIAEAAKAAKENRPVTFVGDLADLTLNVVEAAAHGTKCFAIAAALTDKTNVILSYIDEFQFLDSSQTGVPNSASFTQGESIPDGKVLGSKRVNNKYYSELMQKAGSTMEIAANFDAVAEFADGKSVAELKELSGKPAEEVADAVSGATLEDTAAYLAAIVAAAENYR